MTPAQACPDTTSYALEVPVKLFDCFFFSRSFDTHNDVGETLWDPGYPGSPYPHTLATRTSVTAETQTLLSPLQYPSRS